MDCNNLTLEDLKNIQCEATRALIDKIQGDDATDIEYEDKTYPSIDKKTRLVTEAYLNGTVPELRDLKNIVEADKNIVEQNTQITLIAKNEAIEAANRAEAVVIPTEVTYDISAIDELLGELLRVQVAQQAQISTLRR